ncbi:hypothetical protein B0T16DRAFT_419314 [Cercophora newfieldiana]|uniref:Uncharacterized protein n=1 Tax=Cercophora newfieldiana TaxID=92897 RepID=A0AA39XX01_9PEZI|nr:hypothetical protein B0T16DRAFT_419314 [Cercophora newfieldiana]
MSLGLVSFSRSWRAVRPLPWNLPPWPLVSFSTPIPPSSRTAMSGASDSCSFCTDPDSASECSANSATMRPWLGIWLKWKELSRASITLRLMKRLTSLRRSFRGFSAWSSPMYVQPETIT